MTRTLPLESTTPSTRRTLTRRVLIGGIMSALLIGGGSAAAAAADSTPGAAVPLTQTTTATASASFDHVPWTAQTVTAVCPAGYHATGSGYSLNNGNSTPGQKEQNIEITADYPAAGPDDETGRYYPAPAGSPADAWVVGLNVNTSSTGSITLYVECVG